MADPKYANLPGIDRGQPDVFETSDLPEDDQHLAKSSQGDLSSESVEQLELAPSDAFHQFRGKFVDTVNTDFSDSIGRSRRTGYYVPRSEYEIVGESGIKETPDQKYQRLQHELRELVEDINQVKEKMKTEGSAAGSGMNAVTLTKQVEYLQQQITELSLDRQFAAGSGVDLADPQGALQKRLLTELNSFKASEPKSTAGQPKTSGDSASADSSHVTYQLFYRPEQAKFSNNARVAELEQRLERLEALLGHAPEKITALNSDLATKSLLAAVSTLAARTKLMDPTQLDQVESRLVMVQQRLGQIAEKKEAVEQANKLNKVAELYDLVKKWDETADELPHVVERLTALQQLHEQALQFSQTLAHLEAAQGQIVTHLKSNSELLGQVRSAVDKNMEAVRSNCENLGSRLGALNK